MPAPVILTRAAKGSLLDITDNDTNLTNLANSIGQGVPETTKGDIGVNNGTTNVRQPVGATLGHVLKVNAATATGLEYGADSGVALKSDLALDGLTTGAALVANSGQQVNGVAQLRLLTIVNGKNVSLTYHTTAGDDGHGDFYGVTGAAAGTYIDDNGTVFIPAGGNGSSAWVRKPSGENTYLSWYAPDRTGVADSTSKIQSAITYAETSGKSRVMLGPGSFKVSTTIDMDQSGIFLVGNAGDYFHDNGAGVDAKTKLVWSGAAGGTVINFCSPSDVLAAKRSSGGLIGFEIECLSVGGIGILINSRITGLFQDLHVNNPTIAAYKITTLGNDKLAEACDTQRCIFQNLSHRCFDSPAARNAHGLWLTSHAPAGPSTGNPSLNVFINHSGQNASSPDGTGIGLFIEDGDNNTFISCGFFRVGTATPGLKIVGSNGSCDSNNFIKSSSGGIGGIVIQGIASGYAFNPIRNNFHSVDTGNGSQYPTLDSGCRVFWQDDLGIFVGGGSVGAVFGNTVGSVVTEMANIGTETLRITNGASNHVKITNGTSEWGLNIDGANGDLRINKISGTGAVNVGNGSPVKIFGKLVSEGAVDSGGAGFKLLRVPN